MLVGVPPLSHTHSRFWIQAIVSTLEVLGIFAQFHHNISHAIYKYIKQFVSSFLLLLVFGWTGGGRYGLDWGRSIYLRAWKHQTDSEERSVPKFRHTFCGPEFRPSFHSFVPPLLFLLRSYSSLFIFFLFHPYFPLLILTFPFSFLRFPRHLYFSSSSLVFLPHPYFSYSSLLLLLILTSPLPYFSSSSSLLLLLLTLFSPFLLFFLISLLHLSWTGESSHLKSSPLQSSNLHCCPLNS